MMYPYTTYRFLGKCLMFVGLMIGAYGHAQERLVLPGQELLYPNLTDPSYNAEGNRTQIIAMSQFSGFETDRSSQYINAQLPIFNQLAFGVDYFNNRLDYHKYRQVLLSAVFEIPLGEIDHVKVGLAGGGQSQKMDRIPIEQQTPELIPNINENNIDFTYRIGVHYTGRRISLGGYYTTLPAQQVTQRQDSEDLLQYKILDGYTAYLGYRFRMGERFALTPMFRYLSYTDDAIYEGALKLQLRNKVDASIAYKNEYSINPALRFHFFRALAVGYSYEKAMGKMDFEDVHSLSLSYKFNKSRVEEESEWLETARETLKKTDALKKTKPKKDKISRKGKSDREQKDQEKNSDLEKTTGEASDTPSPLKEPNATQGTQQKNGLAENGVPAGKEGGTKPIIIIMSPRYYVVVKTFDRYDEAYLLKEALKENGHNALVGTVENEKIYHVYIDSEIDRNRATKKLADHGSKAMLKDAYLLEVK